MNPLHDLADLLPWLNLLLVPLVRTVMQIRVDLVQIQTRHEDHTRRLVALEAKKGA